MVQFEVEIPCNTTATVYVPAGGEGVMESGKPISSAKYLQTGETKDGYLEVKLGSGKYRFTSTVPATKAKS
jgi:hypothetical protein